MPLFFKNKTLFVHIPKCGGTSIEKYMADMGDPPMLYDPTGSIFVNGHTPQHLTYREMEAMGLVTEDMRVFSVVRDPLERVVSEFLYLAQHRQDISWRYRSFKGFLRLFLRKDEKYRHIFDNHNLPATEFLKDESGSIPPHITLFSYFDVQGISQYLGQGTPFTDYHFLKTGAASQIGQFVTPKMEKKIREFFSDDYSLLKAYINGVQQKA